MLGMAWTDWSFESAAKQVIPCSELSFCVVLMLRRRKRIWAELPAGVPALTLVCSVLFYPITELSVSFSLSFSVLHFASPSLCLSAIPSLPVSTKVLVSKF